MNAKAASEAGAKVLDTWAVMAWLRDEPAAQRIDELWHLAGAGKIRLLMNAVNLGEVFYLTARWRSLRDAELVLRELQETAGSAAGAEQFNLGSGAPEGPSPVVVR